MVEKLALLVALVVAAVVLATGGAVGAGSNGPDGLTDEHKEQAREALDREAERRAFRKSDEGKRERERSRTAYSGQSSPEAHTTARKKFPELIGPWPTEWPDLRRDEKIDRFLGDNAAVVETADGKAALLESAVPVRGEQPDGDEAPVDLALTDVGDAFAPASSAVPVRVPKHADQRLGFPEASFGLRLADARPATGALTYGKAFYANALEDTDLVVEGAPHGLEVSFVLRSPESPTTPELEFDLRGGQKLRAADGRPGGAEVVDDGKGVAQIDPPTAVDAQGAPVPVKYSVRGDRLAVKVDTDGDVAYPIVVDPVVYQDDRYGQPLGPSMGASWFWWSIRANATTDRCQGAANSVFFACAMGDATLWIESHNAWYGAWDFAAWRNTARPGAYIFRFDVANQGQSGVDHNYHPDPWNPGGPWIRGTGDPVWWNGIMNAGENVWLQGHWTNNVGQRDTDNRALYMTGDTNVYGRYSWFCVNGPSPTDGDCAPDYGSSVSGVLGNKAEIGFAFPNGAVNYTDKPRLVTGGAAVYKVDQSAPKIESISYSPALPGQWTEGYNGSVTLTAFDNGTQGLGANSAGLGPDKAELVRNGTPVQTVRRCGRPPTYEVARGNRYETCHQQWPEPNTSEAAPNLPYTAPEGKSDYTAKVTDLVDNSHSAEWKNWQIKVDTKKPISLGLSNELWDRRGQWIKDGKYRLSRLPEDAADGAGIRTEQVATRREGAVPSSDVAREGFTPDMTGGWGTAELGGAWRLIHNNGADYAVVNGEGQISSNSSQEQLADLPSTQLRNSDVKAQFRLPVSTGTTAGDIVLRRQMGVAGQRGTDANRPYLRVGLRRLAGGQIYIGGQVKLSSGTSTAAFASHNTGLIQTGNEPFLMRAQVEGNQIRIRAWRPGTDEPTTWMVNVTNDSMPQVSGNVGVHVWQATGARHTVGFDDIVVREMTSDWVSQDWTDWDCGPDTDCQIKPNPSAPRVWEWDTSDSAEGQRDIKVEATDPLAYTGDEAKFLRHSLAQTFSVKLDRTLPKVDSVSGELSQDGRWIGPGKTYSISADTSDLAPVSGSGVESVKLEVNGAVVDSEPGDPRVAGQQCNATNGCHTDPGAKTLTWEVPPNHSTATNTVKVYALDAAGNKSLETVRTVKVDDQLPTAPVISGTLRAARNKAVRGSSFGLHVEAQDGTTANPSSGVRQIQLFAGRAIGNLTQRLASPTQSSGSTMTWDTTFSPTAADETRTPRRLRVRVEDQTGNGSDSAAALASRVSRWRLNEASGAGTARDSKGSNDGTYVNGPVLGEAGATTDGDRAARFNGTTSHVNVSNAASLQLANGTVEAWVRAPDPGSGHRGIVTKQFAYGLFLLNGELVAFDWSAGANRSTGIFLNDGDWHHVALSFRSGVAGGTVIYVDGVPRLTTTTTVSHQNNGLQIGGGGTSSNNTQIINGTVDDVSVYSTPLGAADVARLAAAELDDWKLGQWRLNETSGNTAFDTAPRPQLVRNPSFESNVTGWVTNDGAYLVPGAALTRDADSRAPEGGYVGKVVTSAFQSGIGTDFQVVGGRKYRVRVKVKRDAGGSPLKIALGERAPGAEELLITGGAAPGADGFTEYTGLVTPSRTGMYRLFVRLANPATTTTFYVDGASVTEELSGTYNGGYALNQTGATNDGDKAVDLNGSSGYVDLPNVANPANAFSIESWVKLDGLGNEQTIVSQRDGTGTGRTLLGLNSVSGTFISNLGGSTRDSGFAPQAGRFYHVVLTYRGGPNGQWAIYVDGVQRASGTATGESATGGWLLGTNKLQSAGTFWNGVIDDFSVYPDALGSADVARLASQHVYDWRVVFDNGLPTLDAPQPTPSTVWHDENATFSTKLSAYDAVSGVKLFKLFTPGSATPQTKTYDDCSVHVDDLCDTSRAHTFSYGTSTMPEGTGQVRAVTQDPVTNESERTWSVKVDKSAPSLVRSGRAAPNGFWLKNLPYDLTLNASDPYSGIKSLETFVHSPELHASDAFDRTRPTTWGPADKGGDWSEIEGPRSDFGVDDTHATVQAPRSSARSAVLGDVSARDVTARATVELPQNPPASGSSEASLLVRRQSDGKHLRANLKRDGAGQVTIGVTTEAGTAVVAPQIVPGALANGDEVTVRLRATGDATVTARVRAWKTTDPEPSSWHEGTVAAGGRGAGEVGLRAFQDAQDLQSFRFDNLEVYDDGAEQSRDLVANQCNASGCPSPVIRNVAAVEPALASADGLHKLRVRAADPLGHVTQQTWVGGIDRGGPDLRVTGTLMDQEGQEGQEVTAPAQVHMDARDGSLASDGTKRSGVATLKLWVDRDEHASPADQPEFTQSQACPQSSCTMTGDYVFDPAQHTPGEHILTIETTDIAGNLTRKTVRAVVPPDNHALTADRLGLENFFDYDSTETGAGTGLHVNLDNGNAVWHSVPTTSPGRGLSTVVNLTYNSQVRATDMPLPYDTVGRGFSLGISGLTRVNERLDVAAGAATVGLTDTDGTRHQFVSADGGETFRPPPGVNLHLRRYALDAVPGQPVVGTPDKTWAITRPDGVTYFFDQRGWATSVEDRNGNKIRYEYEYRALTEDGPCTLDPPAEVDPLTQDVVCLKRLRRVVDPAGRAFVLTYRDDLLDGLLTSRIETITDHGGRVHRFEYTDNYLTTFRQAVGTGTAERSFSFEYEALIDGESGPDRLLSQRKMKAVVDPRGSRTEIRYPARTVVTTGPDVVSGRTVSSVQDRGDTADDLTDYQYSADDCPLDRRCRVVSDSLERNTRHELDTAGRMVRRVDADMTDEQQQQEDNGDHQQERAEVAWEFAWDDDNNMISMTEAAGTPDAATTEMAYNVNGLLVAREDPRGKVTRLEYDNKPGVHKSPVAATRDGQGVFVSDLDRLVNARGKAWDFDVDERGNQVKQTDPTGAFAETTYDALGQIASETDFRKGGDPVNKTTYFNYHPSGQPQEMVDARGNAPGGDANAHRWFYCYDAAGNLTRATDPRGPGAEVPCDGRTDFTARLVYDALNRVVEEHMPIDTMLEDERVGVYKKGWDDNGNLVREEDAEQAVTDRTFTRMDQVEDELAPSAAHVNPADTDGDPANIEGNAVTERARTHYDYDVEENVRSRVQPLGARTGATGDHQMDFEYDDLNRILVQRRRSTRNVPEEATQLVTSFDYDLRGNLVGVSDAKHNAADLSDPAANAENILRRRFTYKYDLADNRTAAIEAPGTGAGRLHLTTTFAYSPTNKLLFETGPRGNPSNVPAEGAAEDHRKEIRYDDRDMVVDQIDELGNRTHLERRGDGKVVSQTSPRGTATAEAGDFESRFEYYPTGELRRYVFPRDPDDGDGDDDYEYLEQEFDVEYLQRDATGNPTQIRDARDHVINNTFFDNGAVKTTDRAWWWRAEGDRVVERDPTELVQPEQTEEMADEPAGGDYGGTEPQKMQPLVPRAGEATFDYDDEMRLTRVEDADNEVTTLIRDALGRVTTTRQPFGAENATHIETETAYDHHGNVRRLLDGRDQPTTLTYDQYDRQVRRREVGSNTAFETTEMRLDANGKTVETHTPAGNVWRNTYDAVDRLVRSESPEDRNGREITAHSYDAAGNLTEIISPRAPRDANGNLIDDAGDTCTRGTANGDVTNEAADADCFKTKRAYTEANQLETETNGHGSVTETYYDADGNPAVTIQPGSASSDAGEARRRTESTHDARGLRWREVTGMSAGGDEQNAPIRTTITEFDGNGNQRREITPAGIGAGRRPEYPDTDVQRTNPATASHRSSDEIRLATYNAHVREYDEDNIAESVLLPWGDADAGIDGLRDDDRLRFRQDYGIDNRGFVTNATEPYQWVERDGSQGEPDEQRTQYTHFDNGWIRTAEEGPAGSRQTSTYSYDAQGNQTRWVQTSGAAGANQPTRTVVREYYDNGLLRERRASATGSGVRAGNRSYSYTYDRERRPRTVHDPGLSRTTEITHDDAGRELLVDERAPNGTNPSWAKDTLTTYDRDGNVVSRRTDGQANGTAVGSYTGGKLTSYNQDALGREVRTHVDRNNHERYFVNEYYSSGQRKERRRYDDLIDGTHLRSTEKSFFELDGRVNQTKRTSNDGNASTAEQETIRDYSYNTNGNRTEDNRTVRKSGDPDRRHLNSYEYNARNQVIEWVRQRYSGTSRLSRHRVRYEVTGSGGIRRKQEVALNESDQPTRTQGTTFTNQTGGQQLSQQQVTDTGGPGATTHFCNSAFGEVTQTRGDASCPSDPTTSQEAGTTHYDAFGRPDRAIVRRGTGTREVSYRYDGFDRRDFKCDGGTTGACTSGRRVEYSYVGLSERLSEQADSGAQNTNQDREFDYTSDLQPLGFQTKDGNETDQLGEYRSYEVGPTGSIEGLVDNNGQTQENETYHYDPYGKALRRDGSMENAQAPGTEPNEAAEGELSQIAQDNPFRFQGHYYDQGVKTYDMQARQYMPEVGRFQSADRYEAAGADMNLVTDPLTQNRYAFAGGNPVNNLDWDGHEPASSFDACDPHYGRKSMCKRKARTHPSAKIRAQARHRLASARQDLRDYRSRYAYGSGWRRNINVEQDKQDIQHAAHVANRPPVRQVLRRPHVKDDKMRYGWQAEWPKGTGHRVGPKEDITQKEAEILDSLDTSEQILMMRLREKAKEKAAELYPLDVKRDGSERDSSHRNAFRHAYWNALMARHLGHDIARRLATAHEGRPGDHPANETVDLHNNEIGRVTAGEAPDDASDDDLARRVQGKIAHGHMVVLNRRNQLRWSDQVPYPKAGFRNSKKLGRGENADRTEPGPGPPDRYYP